MDTKKRMLDRARKTPMVRFASKPVTDEEVELFWAWVRGQIALKQASVAYDKASSKVYVRFLYTCRHLIESGELQPGKMLQDIEGEWEK